MTGVQTCALPILHDFMREIPIDDTELTLYDIELLLEIKCALCSPDKEGWEVRELI